MAEVYIAFKLLVLQSVRSQVRSLQSYYVSALLALKMKYVYNWMVEREKREQMKSAKFSYKEQTYYAMEQTVHFCFLIRS